jgi:fermentation-respiration switch protein FrsA (DUF1100 family)
MKLRIPSKPFTLAAAAAAALACGAVLDLRADKRHVFYEVAGEYGTARVVERLESGGQPARRVELANHRGEPVASAWVRRPARLAPSYRTLLVFAGRKTGRAILDLLPARDDLVLCAVQYPYESPKTLGGKLRWPADVRRAAYRAVAGGMLAISFLERDERLDSTRLTVVGSSLGSAFAVPLAALDRRVARLVVVHGGGDLPLVVRELEAARGRPWRGRLYGAATALLAASFEPLRYVADVAPREITVVGARSDRTFPQASTLALYEAAREPKRLLWTSGAHVRSKPGVELDEVIAVLDGLLAAEPVAGAANAAPSPRVPGDPARAAGR